MSVRANPTVIGAFVVGAAVLFAAALLVWGGTGFLHTRLDYVLFFDSAVTGLQKGAPVVARGVRVGEVTDVQLRWGTRYVGVYITVEPRLLKGVAPRDARAAIAEAVDRGLRAQLNVQSLLTGVLFVALDSAPQQPIVLRGLDPTVAELPTIPTDVEMWMAKLEKVANSVASLPLQDIVRAAAETLTATTRLLNSPEIPKALRGTDSLVAETRTLVRKVDTLTSVLTAQIDPVAADARATLASARTALADVPRLVDDVRRLVVKVDGHADPLLTSLLRTSDSAQGALDQARLTLDQARATLGGVDGVLGQDSAVGYELVRLMQELSETARALRSLADYLERVPDAPVYGVRRTRDTR
jgi:paraquat-inducible protein B